MESIKFMQLFFLVLALRIGLFCSCFILPRSVDCYFTRNLDPHVAIVPAVTAFLRGSMQLHMGLRRQFSHPPTHTAQHSTASLFQLSLKMCTTYHHRHKSWTLDYTTFIIKELHHPRIHDSIPVATLTAFIGICVCAA